MTSTVGSTRVNQLLQIFDTKSDDKLTREERTQLKALIDEVRSSRPDLQNHNFFKHYRAVAAQGANKATGSDYPMSVKDKTYLLQELNKLKQEMAKSPIKTDAVSTNQHKSTPIKPNAANFSSVPQETMPTDQKGFVNWLASKPLLYRAGVGALLGGLAASGVALSASAPWMMALAASLGLTGCGALDNPNTISLFKKVADTYNRFSDPKAAKFITSPGLQKLLDAQATERSQIYQNFQNDYETLYTKQEQENADFIAANPDDEVGLKKLKSRQSDEMRILSEKYGSQLSELDRKHIKEINEFYNNEKKQPVKANVNEKKPPIDKSEVRKIPQNRITENIPPPGIDDVPPPGAPE